MAITKYPQKMFTMQEGILREYNMHTTEQLHALIKSMEAGIHSTAPRRSNIREEFNNHFGRGSEITGVLEFFMSRIESLEQEVQFLKMHSQPIAGPVAVEYYEQKTTTPQNCPNQSSYVLKY